MLVLIVLLIVGAIAASIALFWAFVRAIANVFAEANARRMRRERGGDA
jgi:hypothetical protein